MFDYAAAERDDGNQDNCGPSRRSESRAEWLEREILPHASAIRSRLLRKYPTLDVDDVLQAAYLRLLAAETISFDKDGSHYLYLVAKSEVVDQARRNHVRSGGIGYDELDDISLAAEEPSADEIIDSKRALASFVEEFRQLSPVQQEVVKLRRMEGWRSRAIAERLTRSVSCVEKSQLSAMRRLARAMAAKGFGKFCSRGLQSDWWAPGYATANVQDSSGRAPIISNLVDRPKDS